MQADTELLVMCRGKVASRSAEENMQDVFPLFEELEQNGFLGPDKLEVLKDLLQELEEWSLFGNVKKFESKRKGYNGLMERIILVLDELDCLGQLVAICRDRIPEEKHGSIQNVRSLFKELENSNSLGIDRLDVLKDILTQKEKTDLLQKVKEFEERRDQEYEFEWRKAQAAEIATSASNNLVGVLNIKTVFKVAAGGVVIASAFQLLKRGCSYDQFVTAVNTCVLPAGVKLMQIAGGSVNLKVRAETVSALDNLWSLYTDGTLRESLQALFITDEMRQLAGGEQVEVIVTIDRQEYEKVRKELIIEVKDPVAQREEEQEKRLYVQRYLEQTKDFDTQSVTTETSDSGMPGSHGAPSELGFGETSDSTSKLCLKDLSRQVTLELTSRLRSDPVTLERFYTSFGLNSEKLRPKGLWDIDEFFPDTPVKTLKDVFEALQLYDLVELLEMVTKPRALRPALSLKDIQEIPSANIRPTKFYAKAKVLIINCSENAATEHDAENFASLFKALNSQSQVTTLAANTSGWESVYKELDSLRKSEKKIGFHILTANQRQTHLQRCLKNKIPIEEERMWFLDELANPERLLDILQKEEQSMKKELNELDEERERLTKERISTIEKIKQKEEELKKEKEKSKMTVSTDVDKWIHQTNDKGDESTLFVILVNTIENKYSDDLQKWIIQGCLKEKLSLIPDSKLVIVNALSSMMKMKEIPRETLQVYLPREIGLGTMRELLQKRYKSLDLVAIMSELKRTFSSPYFSIIDVDEEWYYSRTLGVGVEIHENLSCLPRLQKTEQS